MLHTQKVGTNMHDLHTQKVGTNMHDDVYLKSKKLDRYLSDFC